MPKFTQIPADTFKNIQVNAGVLCRDFKPETGAVTGLLGATSGGIQFTATPTFTDYGEDIDNCPANMKELKRIESVEAKMSGTFITVTADTAAKLAAAADVEASSGKVTPRADLADADFSDLWWVGDYSDVNTGESAGFIAVHLLNALSTGGFQIQSTDKAKGQFAFEFTGHYSMDAQDAIPYELYVKGGTSAASHKAAEGDVRPVVASEAGEE